MTHPGEHPFPTCFVCGPDRPPGDGMRIFVGPLDGNVSADLWVPDTRLAEDGMLRPEFVWAALDCAGGLGAIADAASGRVPFVRGRLSVRSRRPITPGRPHVVVGWRIGGEGRKLLAGSALFSDAGQVLAHARATWIRLAA